MTARGTVISLCILLGGCGEAMSGGADGGLDAGASDGDAGAMDSAAPELDGGIDGGADAAPDDASSGDASSDASSGDASTSDAGTASVCPAFGSPPIDWALPPKGASQPFPDTSTVSCPAGSSSPRYSLFDLDGDGLRDLVVTGTCGTGGDPGLTHWLFHRNTGEGFAAAAMWPLPAGYAGGFPDTETLSCAMASAHRFSTLDLDGDLRPDLVVTSSCSGAGMIGRTHWIVHRNSGTGFASAGSTFALPTYAGSFAEVDEITCAGSEPRHALFDVDGDLDPDLVVTSLCDGTMMVGRTHWLVHLNDGGGFAASATDHALPGGYPGASFTLPANDACPLAGSPRFATTDLDGDRIPDLVVTSLCSGGPIGRARWDVHLGSATGFAASATAWALPTYSGGSFLTTEGPASCAGSAQPRHRLFDADGDAAPDLVITSLCSGAAPLGRSHWAVHLGTGTGFGAALEWALPPDYFGAPLTDTQTVTCASGTSPRYDTVDLDGDGVMDFVATALCSGAGSLGRTEWALHRGCP